MNSNVRELRNALGRFATGVCVVTAGEGDITPFGMTVNSFASLSLDPPLVIWSIGKASDCFERFQELNRYAINILRDDQQPLSDRYAKSGEHDLMESDWASGKTDCPVLESSLATFECIIESRIDGGDHVILVGRVDAFNYREEGKPLLFYSGKYNVLNE